MPSAMIHYIFNHLQTIYPRINIGGPRILRIGGSINVISIPDIAPKSKISLLKASKFVRINFGKIKLVIFKQNIVVIVDHIDRRRCIATGKLRMVGVEPVVIKFQTDNMHIRQENLTTSIATLPLRIIFRHIATTAQYADTIVFQTRAGTTLAVEGHHRWLVNTATGRNTTQTILTPDITALQVHMVGVTLSHFSRPRRCRFAGRFGVQAIITVITIVRADINNQ